MSQPIPQKKYDKTFWYFTAMREIEWGFLHEPESGDTRGFKNEEEAQKEFLSWLSAHPQYRADSPVNLPRDSTIFVDFDGTLYKGRLNVHPVEMEAPDPIAVKTLQQLSSAGYKITLYSCRSNPVVVGSNEKANQLTSHMQMYCEKHKIPFDNIEPFKPHYHMLIDDNAVSGRDWNGVRAHLGMTAYEEPVEGADPRDLNQAQFIGLR